MWYFVSLHEAIGTVDVSNFIKNAPKWQKVVSALKLNELEFM